MLICTQYNQIITLIHRESYVSKIVFVLFQITFFSHFSARSEAASGAMDLAISEIPLCPKVDRGNVVRKLNWTLPRRTRLNRRQAASNSRVIDFLRSRLRSPRSSIPKSGISQRDEWIVYLLISLANWIPCEPYIEARSSEK